MTPLPPPVNPPPCPTCAGSGVQPVGFWHSKTWKTIRRGLLFAAGALLFSGGQTICQTLGKSNPALGTVCTLVLPVAQQAVAKAQADNDISDTRDDAKACAGQCSQLGQVGHLSSGECVCEPDRLAQLPDAGIDVIPQRYDSLMWPPKVIRL